MISTTCTLLFLNPIVKDFEMVNVFFQATSADPEEMTKELDILHRSLRHRIKDKFGASVSLNMADYRAQFLGQMERVRRAYSTRSELFQTRSTEVKMRCYKFMENLLLEVENRLPSSTAVFRGLSGLSPLKNTLLRLLVMSYQVSILWEIAKMKFRTNTERSF